MRILLILLFPLTLFAQEVRPPVVTYSQKKVLDSWELRNMSETVPLTVVALTPKTFIIDAKGNPTFADIDPTKISIRLSEHSFRIPPARPIKLGLILNACRGRVGYASLHQWFKGEQRRESKSH